MSEEMELRLAWAELVPPTPHADDVFEELLGRHREAHRRYHGPHHVAWVLRHANRLEAALPECRSGYDAAAVTAAALFHDVVYDPTAADNEHRSAMFASYRLASLGWSPARCAVVTALIEATAGHLSGDDAEDAGAPSLERDILLDADLAVLGAEPAAYAEYTTGVRMEYGHLTDASWAAGRSAVIRNLLGREQLFRTSPGRDWWEHRARANLTAELASLER